MKKSTQFSFDDLLRDVIDKGLCNKCGVCVSFCTANQIGAIEMCGCEENVPQYVDSDKCFRCGICYLICPQTHELNEEVKDEFGWSSPIGIFRDICSAQATDGAIREVATDGGVVTALLSYMLENKIVDGAIVAKRTGLFTREPEIVTTRDGLIQAAGSQFSELPHLEEMGKKYSTYVSVIPVVRMFGPKLSTKLAVVGTPCQIKAIRKMQVLNILPSDVVFFTIGLFCMQCFTFDNFLEKTFIKRDQINPEDILKINVKEDFRLIMKSGRTIHIPFEEIEDIAKPACLACQEFANDFADISVGGIGSPDGYTTTMIRTTLGKRIFTDAVRRGYIKP
ncbi:MAG: Coenzyme F420 hydrogenase/dehydrogenase, beta subunit C-terminal domain, partial [Candidatus Marinimicrobia bacterium]|nr:Coenzyme F420 hydrogenase/dehydrogenase, beta subunit C-terminal domain [Candidatus Neomarinimicrobiota bacterium]